MLPLIPVIVAGAAVAAGIRHIKKKSTPKTLENVFGKWLKTYNIQIDKDELNDQDEFNPDICCSDGDPLLIHAIKSNNSEFLNTVIKEGANVNIHDKNGIPAISVAAQCSSNMLTTILKAGADILALDRDGNSIIFYCADEFMVKLLTTTYEILPDSRNTLGQNVLFFCQDPELMKALIQAGADVNARDIHGQTPLFVNSNLACSRMLLAMGAVSNIKDYQGNSILSNAPVDLAISILTRSDAIPSEELSTTSTRYQEVSELLNQTEIELDMLIRLKRLNAIRYLIRNGLSTHLKLFRQNQYLYEAILHSNDQDLIQMLMQESALPLRLSPEAECQLIHDAAAAGHYNILEIWNQYHHYKFDIPMLSTAAHDYQTYLTVFRIITESPESPTPETIIEATMQGAPCLEVLKHLKNTYNSQFNLSNIPAQIRLTCLKNLIANTFTADDRQNLALFIQSTKYLEDIDNTNFNNISDYRVITHFVKAAGLHWGDLNHIDSVDIISAYSAPDSASPRLLKEAINQAEGTAFIRSIYENSHLTFKIASIAERFSYLERCIIENDTTELVWLLNDSDFLTATYGDEEVDADKILSELMTTIAEKSPDSLNNLFKVVNRLDQTYPRFNFTKESLALNSIVSDKVDIIVQLLNSGFDVDYILNDKTMLEHAIESKSIATANMLLDHNASVDRSGHSSILDAMYSDMPSSFIRKLMECGASPHAVSAERRMTPLKQAQAWGKLALIELFGK